LAYFRVFWNPCGGTGKPCIGPALEPAPFKMILSLLNNVISAEGGYIIPANEVERLSWMLNNQDVEGVRGMFYGSIAKFTCEE